MYVYIYVCIYVYIYILYIILCIYYYIYMGPVHFPGPKDAMIRVCYYRWFIWMEYIYIYIHHPSIISSWWVLSMVSHKSIIFLAVPLEPQYPHPTSSPVQFLFQEYFTVSPDLRFSQLFPSLPRIFATKNAPKRRVTHRLGRQRQRANVALQQRLGLCGFIPGWC